MPAGGGGRRERGASMHAVALPNCWPCTRRAAVRGACRRASSAAGTADQLCRRPAAQRRLGFRADDTPARNVGRRAHEGGARRAHRRDAAPAARVWRVGGARRAARTPSGHHRHPGPTLRTRRGAGGGAPSRRVPSRRAPSVPGQPTTSRCANRVAPLPLLRPPCRGCATLSRGHREPGGLPGAGGHARADALAASVPQRIAAVPVERPHGPRVGRRPSPGVPRARRHGLPRAHAHVEVPLVRVAGGRRALSR
mmetsp:Transcript_31850/g.93792  ORF Transcript_31850/g.93792 Transcript_31850/m.93792 type:complete len:253 (+) Transcript_31850:195-953(+)